MRSNIFPATEYHHRFLFLWKVKYSNVHRSSSEQSSHNLFYYYIDISFYKTVNTVTGLLFYFCEAYFTSVQNMCTLNASNITSEFRIFAMFVTVLPGIFYTQCVGMWPSNQELYRVHRVAISHRKKWSP